MGRNSSARGVLRPRATTIDVQLALFPGFEIEGAIAELGRGPGGGARAFGAVALVADAADGIGVFGTVGAAARGRPGSALLLAASRAARVAAGAVRKCDHLGALFGVEQRSTAAP